MNWLGVIFMFHIDFMNFKPVLAIDHDGRTDGPRTTDDEFCDQIASPVLRTNWLIKLLHQRPNFLRFFGVWETEFGLREMELPQSGKFKEQKWLRFIGLGFKRPRDYVVLVIIWLGNLNKYTHWETFFCLCKVPYFMRSYESHLYLHFTGIQVVKDSLWFGEWWEENVIIIRLCKKVCSNSEGNKDPLTLDSTRPYVFFIFILVIISQ